MSIITLLINKKSDQGASRVSPECLPFHALFSPNPKHFDLFSQKSGEKTKQASGSYLKSHMYSTYSIVMCETVAMTFKIYFATYRRICTSKPHYRPHDDDEINKDSEPGWVIRWEYHKTATYTCDPVTMIFKACFSGIAPQNFQPDFNKLCSSSCHPNYRIHDDNKWVRHVSQNLVTICRYM